MTTWRVAAPAKLTWSLFVGERRSDGYHDIDAEMCTLDLADTLEITEPGRGLEIDASDEARAEALEVGSSNLITRALALCGRHAHVALEKQIPLGGGLGGGSADAGAILRWAGATDLEHAAQLGGDVPFCTVGGRARVAGIGEQLRELEHVTRHVVLLLPPVFVPTADAYRALDELRAEGRGHHERNDFTEAAERVAPTLRRWRSAFHEASGREPVLAGSGSTMFVEGQAATLGLEARTWLEVDGQRASLIEARTTPSSFGMPIQL